MQEMTENIVLSQQHHDWSVNIKSGAAQAPLGAFKPSPEEIYYLSCRTAYSCVYSLFSLSVG
jgi:hypothetical protein